MFDAFGKKVYRSDVFLHFVLFVAIIACWPIAAGLYVCFRPIWNAIVTERDEDEREKESNTDTKTKTNCNVNFMHFSMEKLFIFAFGFLSRKIVIHHHGFFCWSDMLWTCLAVCLLMLGHKVSLCYWDPYYQFLTTGLYVLLITSSFSCLAARAHIVYFKFNANRRRNGHHNNNQCGTFEHTNYVQNQCNESLCHHEGFVFVYAEIKAPKFMLRWFWSFENSCAVYALCGCQFCFQIQWNVYYT